MKPFDHEILRQSVIKTQSLITLEALSSQDGLFNLALQSSVGVPNLRVRQLAINGFVHGYGTYNELCSVAGLTVSDVIDAVHEVRDPR